VSHLFQDKNKSDRKRMSSSKTQQLAALCKSKTNK